MGLSFKINTSHVIVNAEFFLESILNLVGFAVGIGIGIISYIGFRITGSPTLFRLSLAFFSMGIGFMIMWLGLTLDMFVYKTSEPQRWIQTLGIAAQTLGYFFIAFSHTIKSFFPKSNYLRSIGVVPILKDNLEQKLGIPSLVIDCDILDPTFAPRAATEEKMDRFFEMVENSAAYKARRSLQ